MNSSSYTTLSKSIVKQLSVFVLAITVLLSSCSGDDPEDVTPIETGPTLTAFQIQAIDYFVDVALGFENGGVPEIVRKWSSQNRMKLYISGASTSDLMVEVNNTITELNELMSPEMDISLVNTKDESNAHLLFGSEQDFIDEYPDLAGDLSGNFGIFNVWWTQSQQIDEAVIWIKTNGPTFNQQVSLIKEEITQSLGLGKDSPLYPGSIFYETSSDGGFSTTFSDLDREIIRLLYLPEIEVGRNEGWVRTKLVEIYVRENQD